MAANPELLGANQNTIDLELYEDISAQPEGPQPLAEPTASPAESLPPDVIDLRDKMTTDNLPLAYSIASRMTKGIAPSEDIRQVAATGLFMAASRFDPTRGNAFSTFATATIMGEIKKDYRNNGWGIRVARGIQENSLQVSSLIEDLTHEYKRDPTVQEIAAAAELSPEAVEEAIAAQEVAHFVGSLDVAFDPDRRERQDWQQRVSDERGYDPADTIPESMMLNKALEQLNESERKIIEMRFTKEMTQSQVGKELGISQMHAGRKIEETLRKLRSLMTE